MISQIITGLVQGIYNVCEELFIEGKKKETVEQYIVKTDIVYQKITFLLHKIGASRIYIRQYHNGGKFYSGQSIQRFSCTYEAVSEGISPAFAELQNNFVSENPALHLDILNKKESNIPDTSLEPDLSLRRKFSDRGISSYYSTGIWGLDGSLIGLLCVDFVNNKRVVSEDDKHELKQFADQVVGYLTKDEECEKSKTKLITKILAGIFILIFFTELFTTLSPLLKLAVKFVKDSNLEIYL